MIFLSLVEQWLMHVPLLLGSYISFYLLKVPDLSIESAYTFGAFCGALFIGYCPPMHPFMQLLIVLIISCVAGGFVGALSSGLSSLLGVSHLLATIMTTGIIYSLNQYIIGSYYSISTVQNPLILNSIPGHPEFVVLLFLVCILTYLVYWVLKTQIGFCIIAYGINNNFFKHYMISSSYIFIIGAVVANCLGGISGYLQAQSNGFVEISMGFNKSLLCLTALIFGKVFVPSSSMNHLGHPIIGGCAYFILQYGLIFIGFDSTLFTAMQAIGICIVLAFRTKTSNFVKHSMLGI